MPVIPATLKKPGISIRTPMMGTTTWEIHCRCLLLMAREVPDAGDVGGDVHGHDHDDDRRPDDAEGHLRRVLEAERERESEADDEPDQDAHPGRPEARVKVGQRTREHADAPERVRRCA